MCLSKSENNYWKWEISVLLNFPKKEYLCKKRSILSEIFLKLKDICN